MQDPRRFDHPKLSIFPGPDATILAMTPGITVLAALFLQAGVGVAAVAAEPPVARARLVLRAAPDCLTRAALVARVEARSPRIQFVDDVTVVGVDVNIRTDAGDGVDAQLLLVEPGAKPKPRRLRAASCVEAADTVALIIAVALDPVWVREHPSQVDLAPPATPNGTEPTSNSSEPTRPFVAVPSHHEANVSEHNAPQRAVATPYRYGVHLAGQMIWGPAPAVMPGVGVHVSGTFERGAFLSPALLLGVTHAWRDGLEEAGGTASFVLDAGTLDVCALRVRFSRIDVRACGALLAGRLSARGSDTTAPVTVSRFFSSAGIATVLSARLGSRVEWSARLGTGMTIRRDSYEFTPTTFHYVSRFTTSASFAVGLLFP